ncbi:MFS transporter [uncultured Piscinibacter sp.]|uniref:MFS transporter n=1 Tax=uncultured Piscinibacter sp. TaxID=1131835 RepID=UPI002607B11F|nr:MFS transporter [uncultured Piscinibacter sp.]
MGPGRVLVALIVGQICLHSCMTGVRMAAPLQALREGHAAWVVGLLMGLFAAAPVALALQAGGLADRRGYHHPMRIAVLLTVLGGGAALAASWMPAWTFAAMCVAAMLVGAGANVGMIAIQRTAGRHAVDATAMKRVFSWLGLAPALANMVGPVLAGVLIDLGGFRAAYAVLLMLPLAALAWARRVPREAPARRAPDAAALHAGELLRTPGLRRLLAVNWLLSSSWDVHALLVPVLGHERGFPASAIGLVLGLFAIAVAAVRLAIPLIAQHLREGQVLAGAMLWTAGVFALYPLANTAGWMGLLAAALGLALGAVQPMIMTTLHQITPAHRHGEAIALRSMTINLSSALMPVLFGALGALVGASALFWLMGAAVGVGSMPARRIAAVPLRT